MSFYAGRHRVGSVTKRQCHITANPQSIGYMQGGVQSDTVFHTDVKYTGYKTYVMTAENIDVIIPTGPLTSTHGYTYTGDGSYVTDIAAGYAYMLVQGTFGSGRKLQAVNQPWTFWYEYHNPVHTSTPVVFGESALPTSSAKNMCIVNTNASGNFGTMTLIVFDFKLNGYMRYPFYPSTNNILMRGGSVPTFNVNGIDVAKIQYLNLKELNTIDVRVPMGAVTMQFINSIDSGSGIEVKSTPMTGTQIKVGSKIIIDSTKGSVGFKVSGTGVVNSGNISFRVDTRPYKLKLLSAPPSGGIHIASVNYSTNTVTKICSRHFPQEQRIIGSESRIVNNSGHRYYMDYYTYTTSTGELWLYFYPHGSITASDTVDFGSVKVSYITIY